MTMVSNRKYFSIDASGIVSLSGKRYFRFERRGRIGFVPTDIVGGNMKAAIDLLAQQDIVLPTGNAGAVLSERCTEVESFSRMRLIDRSGWCSDCFMMPDGTAFVPDGAEPVTTLIPVHARQPSSVGTLEEWKGSVAALVTGQTLPMFLTMLPLAAPLLELSGRGSVVFELTGGASAGVATGMALAASACGSPVGMSGYSTPFGSFLRDVTDHRASAAGSPLILRDVDARWALLTPAQKRANFGAFVLPGDAATPVLTLLGTTSPLSATLAEDDALIELAHGRLITLQVSPNRRFGLFDSLPEGVDSVSALEAQLADGMANHHGVAMHSFLQRLVNDRAADQANLAKRIANYLAMFRSRSEVKLNDRSSVAVADAFGIVFAAGRLARAFGVLPKAWEIGPTVLECYRQFLPKPKASTSLVDQLRALAAREEVRQLGNTTNVAGEDDMRRARLFVRDTGRQQELMIRSSAINAVLPDWKASLAVPANKALLLRDGDHLTRKRKLGGRSERVFCFRLPPAG